jgi:hypothetical protein
MAQISNWKELWQTHQVHKALSFALALENVSVISPERPLVSEWLLQKDTIQQ